MRKILAGNVPTRWLAWSAGVMVAVLLSALASIYARFPGDLLLAQWLQSVRPSWLAPLGEGLHYLGRSPFFAMAGVAVAVILLTARQGLAASFLLLSLIARASVGPLKDFAQRPRPTPDLIQVSEQANGFSFPSGHVLGSVLLWGFLCYLASRMIPHRALRLAVQTALLAIPLLTGWQRIEAGAHWPSDVLGGYLWGALLLFVVVKAYESCQGRLCGSSRAEGKGQTP